MLISSLTCNNICMHIKWELYYWIKTKTKKNVIIFITLFGIHHVKSSSKEKKQQIFLLAHLATAKKSLLR